MKSSTLSRSNLSREKMAVLETLSNYKSDSIYNESLSVYVRPNKEKELDVLWQNFRVNQKDEKTPGIYLATGFIAGAIVMLIITIMLELAYYSTTQNIFNIVGNISLVLLAVSLIIGSIFAISERSITKPITQDNNSMKITTKNDILDIILKFIPLYNVYLWYEKHDFE